MNRPSALMDAWSEAPDPAAEPSLLTEIKLVFGVHPVKAFTHDVERKTCGVVPSNANPETKSVASDEYATTVAPVEFTTGEKLGPFATTPAGPRLTNISRGTQLDWPRQVSRRKIFDVLFVSGLGGGLIVVVSNRFVAEDAKATNLPLASIEGPN